MDGHRLRDEKERSIGAPIAHIRNVHIRAPPQAFTHTGIAIDTHVEAEIDAVADADAGDHTNVHLIFGRMQRRCLVE